MQQEERDECAATQTQHEGFFVNTGEMQVTTSATAVVQAKPIKQKKEKKRVELIPQKPKKYDILTLYLLLYTQALTL